MKKREKIERGDFSSFFSFLQTFFTAVKMQNCKTGCHATRAQKKRKKEKIYFLFPEVNCNQINPVYAVFLQFLCIFAIF
jgi:hypothetical protein